MCNEATFLSGALGWTAYCDARERAREHHDMAAMDDRRAAVPAPPGGAAAAGERAAAGWDAGVRAPLAPESPRGD